LAAERKDKVEKSFIDVITKVGSERLNFVQGKVAKSNFDVNSLFSMDFLNDIKAVYNTATG
jgi:hypothetical protein